MNVQKRQIVGLTIRMHYSKLLSLSRELDYKSCEFQKAVFTLKMERLYSMLLY